jgi:hypothetical protein
MKRKSIFYIFSKSPNYSGPSVEEIAKEMKKIHQERVPGSFANAFAEYEKNRELVETK